MDARQRNEARRNRGRHSRDTRGSFGGSERSNVIDLSSLGTEIPWFRVLEETKNEIDIVEFIITQEWYPKLKARGGGRLSDLGLEVGALDYKLEIPVHQYIGSGNASHLCPYDAFGDPCPICEEKFAKLEANSNKWDRKTMGPLNASWRDFYNIYDYNNPDVSFHPWEAAFTSFEKIMQDELDKQKDELFPWALDAGNTIEFKGREKPIGDGKKYIEPQIPDFFPRDPYSEEILEQVISFDKYLVFSTYDQIAADQYGMPAVETTATGVADQKPDPQPETRTRTQARTRPQEDPPPDNPSRRRPEPEPEPENPPWEGKDNLCPSGYNFGHDCNKQPECSTCPDLAFDKCVALQDEILKKGTIPEPPKTQSRRRSNTTDDKTTTTTQRRRRT